MSRIGWLSNFNPFEEGGGAEKNDKGMIEAGIKRGHSINIITPRTPYVDYDNFDFIIISNCNQFDINSLVNISQKIPYILFHHDFQFCKYQLWFTGLEKCKNCPNKQIWNILIENAKLNIFLSPYHYQMYSKVFDKDILEPHVEVPSCIKIEDWQPNPEIKIQQNTCICVNSLYGFKGKDQVLEYIKKHPELKFTIVGDNPDNVQLPENAKYIGRVSNPKLKELFQKSEYLLHLPISGPFERVLVEYLLCNPKGKLITNDRVGCLTYDIFTDGKIDRDKLKNLLREAPNLFWKSVENAI